MPCVARVNGPTVELSLEFDALKIDLKCEKRMLCSGHTVEIVALVCALDFLHPTQDVACSGCLSRFPAGSLHIHIAAECIDDASGNTHEPDRAETKKKPYAVRARVRANEPRCFAFHCRVLSRTEPDVATFCASIILLPRRCFMNSLRTLPSSCAASPYLCPHDTCALLFHAPADPEPSRMCLWR